MGGQIANSLAGPLHEARGSRCSGPIRDNIDRAEDRHKFSRLLDGARHRPAAWKEARSLEDARGSAARSGYPVLVRPSYVL